MANRLNQLRNWLTGYAHPVENRSTSCARPVEDVPKPSLSPSGILFPVEVIPLLVEVRLRQR